MQNQKGIATSNPPDLPSLKKTSGSNWYSLSGEWCTEENTVSLTQESQAQAHLMRRNWQSQIEESTLKQLDCTHLEYNRRLRSCSR